MRLTANQIEDLVNGALPPEIGGIAVHWTLAIDAVAGDGSRFFGLVVAPETPNWIAKGMLLEGIDELRNDPPDRRHYG